MRSRYPSVVTSRSHSDPEAHSRSMRRLSNRTPRICYSVLTFDLSGRRVIVDKLASFKGTVLGLFSCVSR